MSSKLIIFQAACAYVYASGTVVQSGELRGVLFLFYFFHTSTFQLLDKPWSQVSSILPPGSRLQFFMAFHGF